VPDLHAQPWIEIRRAAVEHDYPALGDFGGRGAEHVEDVVL
jgi:hypothetical protein